MTDQTTVENNDSTLLSSQEIRFLIWCIGIAEGHAEKMASNSYKEYVEKMREPTMNKLLEIEEPEHQSSHFDKFETKSFYLGISLSAFSTAIMTFFGMPTDAFQMALGGIIFLLFTIALWVEEVRRN